MYKLIFLLFIFEGLILSGCGGDTGSTLVGDSVPVNPCPTGGCADFTPKLANTFIGISEPSISIESTQDRLDVSGLCGTSTYSDNEIDIYFQYTNSTTTTPLEIRTCKMTPLTKSSTNNSILKCINGRFHAILGVGTGSSSCLTPSASTGRSYQLVVQLGLKSKTTDTQKQQNTATGKYMVPVLRN